MTQLEAIELIEKGIPKLGSQHWIDLGAGTGVFTNALAELLGADGTVYAVDEQRASLEKIKDKPDHATIMRLQLDFVKEDIPINQVDGILLANSFHYVKEKKLLMARLKKILKPDGRFVFIEYDTLKANPWIPYPINFSSLRSLMQDMGFSSVEKLKDRSSVFNRAMMYSALVI
jgi:ubiquinone/menaquinone biosynthesis C-methylase UbiE